MHDGILAFEFESLDQGTLKRDSASGLIIPQFNFHTYPHVFQIFSTGRMLPSP